MGPAQIAVVLMMHDQQLAAEAAARRRHHVPRESFATRFAEQLRRFTHRAQLGPVAGHAAA